MKTEMERAVDKALDLYLERFGKPYPIGPGHAPTEEVLLKEIEEAINTGVPVHEPDYDEDNDY